MHLQYFLEYVHSRFTVVRGVVSYKVSSQ